MAERNRAAVDVHAILRHSELTHRRDDLRRERLVELDEVDVGERHAGEAKRLRHGLDRPDAHDVGIDASRRERDEPRERLEA